MWRLSSERSRSRFGGSKVVDRPAAQVRLMRTGCKRTSRISSFWMRFRVLRWQMVWVAGKCIHQMLIYPRTRALRSRFQCNVVAIIPALYIYMLQFGCLQFACCVLIVSLDTVIAPLSIRPPNVKYQRLRTRFVHGACKGVGSTAQK